MKKVLLSLGILAAAYSASYSQELPAHQRYNFSSSTLSYTPLSSAATVVALEDDGDGAWDDAISAPITLPISFNYQNVPVTSIEIDTYGGLILNGIYNDAEIPQIIGLYMDYAGTPDRGEVLYETIGSTGSRIFKVEFRNVSSYVNHTGTDTFNFQIWLYEGSNVIETHTGYSNVPREYFFQDVTEMMSSEEEKDILMSSLLTNEGDVIMTDLSTTYFHNVTDDVTAGTYDDSFVLASSVVDGSDPTAFDPLIIYGYPAEGQVFRYTPLATTSTETIDPAHISIYPNPAQGQLTVQLMETLLEGSRYSIFDVYGRQMMTDALTSGQQTVDIHTLPAGQYFLQITNGQQGGTYQFTKL